MNRNGAGYDFKTEPADEPAVEIIILEATARLE